jgi:4-amino-4-deoxy-L-arabinose transferase-like glycosyltransferase
MVAAHTRRALPLLLLVAAAWFVGLEYRGLFQPDEGRYASIALEMLHSGDWITPRLNGLKYFEKPPLQYWATAAAYAAFGADEWTTRLWPALTGFLGIALAAFCGTRLSPGRPWLLTVLIFSGCWGYFLAAQLATLDMGLNFFLSAALFAFLLARRDGLTARAERGWMLAAWAAMALAVLSKGLIGVVIPGLALILYSLVERDFSAFRRLHLLPGLPLFLALAAPWFIAVQLRNPEFFDFFFIREHFQRFALSEHHRAGPWWYFIPILLIGLLPWTPRLPEVIAAGWKAPGWHAFKPDRFLIVWAAVVFIFFSVSHSKLPLYILPAIPALLLLLARHGSTMKQRAIDASPVVIAGYAVFLAAVGAALLAYEQITPWDRLADDYALWLFAAAAVALVAAAAAFRLRSRPDASFAAVAIGSLLTAQVALSGMHAFDEYYSSERLIDRMAREKLRFAPDAAFYSLGTFDPSVPFYLGRRVTLVEYKGELTPGIAFEPDKQVPSIEEFIHRWVLGSEAYAIMPPRLYESLQAAGLPGRILAQDRRRVVLARF